MTEEMQRILERKRDEAEKKRILGSDLYCDLTATTICEGLFLFAKNYLVDYNQAGELIAYYNLMGKISAIKHDKETDIYDYVITSPTNISYRFKHSSLTVFSTYMIDVLETRKSLITDFLA